MVDDPSRPASDNGGRLPADAGHLAVVYRAAVECASHPTERVRVVAAGTLAAAAWTYGVADIAPVSGRALQRPTTGQVVTELVIAQQLRNEAETPLEYAHDTGVVDWLALVAGTVPPGREPWWQPLLDAVAEQPTARAAP